MEKCVQRTVLYQKSSHTLIKRVGLNLFAACLFLICGCKGKNVPNVNSTLIPQDTINLDLDLSGSFGALYVHGSSILCNKTILSGSATLWCSFTLPGSEAIPAPTSTIFSSAYTIELAASIANACSIDGISPNARFTSSPFVSSPCASGTSITCYATGVDPVRNVVATGICPE